MSLYLNKIPLTCLNLFHLIEGQSLVFQHEDLSMKSHMEGEPPQIFMDSNLFIPPLALEAVEVHTKYTCKIG